MIRARLRAQARSDEGASLLLALLFLFSIGITLAALLPYSRTGIAAAASVRNLRSVQNATDGAVDGAIQSVRYSNFLGRTPGQSCGTYNAPTYPDPLGGSNTVAVSVTCVGAAGGFIPDDEPTWAIETLTHDLNVTGNANLNVNGPVFSHGKVLVGNPQQSLAIVGDLYATGNCDTAILVSGVDHCANTSPAYSATSDPDGADALAAIPDPLNSVPSTVDPVGTCANTNSVVAFVAGFYSETPQPGPSCTGNNHAAWWFQPGTYYFDFPDGTIPGHSDNDSAWNVNNITIVGGALLSGWDASTSSSTIVGAKGSVCDPGQPGADFVFGGPTHLSVGPPSGATSIEICGAKVGTSNEVAALWGWRGTTSRSTTPASSQLDPTTPSTPSAGDAFQPSPASRVADGVLASDALSGDGPTTGTVTLGGFPTVPDGSLIVSARLRITHVETSATSAAAAAKVAPSVKVTSTGGLSQTSPVANRTTLGDTLVPLTLPVTQAWKSLAGLSVAYTANGSNLNPTTIKQGITTPAETAIASLDGVRLEVTYIAPAFEGARCPSGNTPCLLLNNTVSDAVFFKGTVYTPNSDLFVNVHNFSTTAFRRGVITGGLTANVSPSTKQTEPPFQVPGHLSTRRVLFEATPAGSNRPRLRALVEYTDYVTEPDGSNVAHPGASVKILEWTVLR